MSFPVTIPGAWSSLHLPDMEPIKFQRAGFDELLETHEELILKTLKEKLEEM